MKNALDKMIPIGVVSSMNKNSEKWKPIVDYPKYLISDCGRVSRDGKLIKAFFICGYPSFNVVDGGERRKSLRVHREVLRAFIGMNPGKHARHLDGNKINCLLDNLAWGTAVENEADKARHGRSLRGERHHQCILSASQVIEIRNSNLKGIDLAERFSVSPSVISCIRKRKSWTHL